MILIGLGNKARQGKNTVAVELCKLFAHQGVYAKQYAFADALKDYCRVAYGMKDKDPRLLQLVGTDIFRERIDSNTWVNVLKSKLEDENPEVGIVTDVRFENEVGLIWLYNGITIRVTRIDANGEVFSSQDRDPNHPSELALDNPRHWYEHIVASNLSDLHNETACMFEQVIYPHYLRYRSV